MQIDERRFAGAAQPDNRNDLSGLDAKRDVTQDVLSGAVLILKSDLAELDVLS